MSGTFKNTVYHFVNDAAQENEEEVCFLTSKGKDHHDSSFEIERSGTKRGRLIFLIIVTLVNFIMFLISVALYFLSLRETRSIEMNVDNRLVKMTSSYSPIFDKIPITLTTQKANGSFWPQREPSQYQLPPSAEVDEAWERLADTHGIALTTAEVKMLGQDPNTVWPYPSTYKIPGHTPNDEEKTYMALPNIFHQIHCLNMFRKLAHPAYYGEFWTHTTDFPIQAHIGHCQYMLLQTLKCHSDLEVVTFNKVKGTPGPFPDFSVEKKCRNFDDVLEWKERNQINVSDEEWKEILETPEGIRELDAEGRTLPFL